MPSKPADSFETYLVPPRSLKKTAGVFLVLCMFALVGGVLLPVLYFGQAPGSQDPWTTLTTGGAALYSQIGWTSSLYVTVLIGFFAVTIGGQIFGGPLEATRLRRTLGNTGLLLASSSVPPLVYVASYCLSSEKHWAGLIALLPASALIIFLALHVGRFVVFDSETKLRALDYEVNRRVKRMDALAKHSRGPLLRGLAIPSVLIGMAALLPMVVGNKDVNWMGIPVAVVLLSLVCLAISVLGWLLLRNCLTDLSVTWSVPWIFWLVIVQLLVLFILVTIFDQAGVRVGLGSAFFATGCLILAVTPRSWQPQWLLNRTVNGLAAASALRVLRSQQTIAEKNLADLMDEIKAMEELRSDSSSDRESIPVTPLTRLFRFIAARENVSAN